MAAVPFSELAASSRSATGILVAGLYSDDKGRTWSLKRLGHTFERATNFEECLEDVRDACVAANILRKAPYTGGKMLTEHTVYQMQKRDQAVVSHKHVLVGLGWEILHGSPKIDLDASCVLLGPPSNSGFQRVVDTVWHNDTQAPGVVHSGDNRTGDGSGDDERIDIDFTKLPKDISRLAIVINSFNGSFKSVQRAWARVLDASTGREMSRYQLETQGTQAIVICAFNRQDDGQWLFEAVGSGCDGRTAKSGETVDAIRGRPSRPIRELRVGESVPLPSSMYDDSGDVFSILDEWGCRGEWLWLDATVLLFSKTGDALGEIDFDSKEWPSKHKPIIVHSGDRQDEKQAHGSHEIRIKMKRLTEERPDVFSVLLVMSAYSLNLCAAVKPFVSLRDSDSAELARFEPDSNYDATSLQMIDLHRHQEGWMMTAHGLLGDGKANEYEPIKNAYKLILQQIVSSEGRSLQLDYDTVRRTLRQRTYAKGHPIV